MAQCENRDAENWVIEHKWIMNGNIGEAKRESNVWKDAISISFSKAGDTTV